MSVLSQRLQRHQNSLPFKIRSQQRIQKTLSFLGGNASMGYVFSDDVKDLLNPVRHDDLFTSARH